MDYAGPPDPAAPVPGAAMWDEVLCGYQLADHHHNAILVGSDHCLRRWVLRTFERHDELLRRLELLAVHWEQPLPFDRRELSPLIDRYLAQVRRFAVESGDAELEAMTEQPVQFDPGPIGSRVSGDGNARWLELLRPHVHNVRKWLPEPEGHEVRNLSLLLDEVAWLPELGLSLRGPLEPVDGFDSEVFLQCWIRNAAPVLTEDCLMVYRRIEGR